MAEPDCDRGGASTSSPLRWEASIRRNAQTGSIRAKGAFAAGAPRFRGKTECGPDGCSFSAHALASFDSAQAIRRVTGIDRLTGASLAALLGRLRLEPKSWLYCH